MKKVLVFLFLSIISFSSQAALIHQYDFEGGVIDLVGSENGTFFNGASINAGVLTLDGVDDYVEFASHIIPTGDFTVSFYARQDSNQINFREMISQGGGRFYVGHDISDIIRVGDSWLNTTVPFPLDGALHHYVVTADTSIPETNLYIDGVLLGTTNVAVPALASGTFTRIGQQFTCCEAFHGGFDDLSIYDNALSEAEVGILAFGVPTAVPMFSSKFLLILFAFIGIVGLYRVRLNS